ncbi:phage antirepressor KilAC domain-containing protein [Enterococcus faecalis]|nr:phage antirepressor KilAC domain-containing protein [Enterococcus faecalis]
MNQLIKVTTNENDEQLVSARDLYGFLGIKKRFSAWWKQYDEMFIKEEDFTSVPGGTPVSGGNGNIQYVSDYVLKLDVAKHISMLTKTEKGKEARKYFIQLEKFWNSPEMVTKRALKFQQKKIEKLELENQELRPKALFADAVSASETSISVNDMAKILKQNGFDIGQNRLFDWLRKRGYLIKRRGTSFNVPTQRSMELKIFEIKETTIVHSNGQTSIKKTPKITGKGQRYILDKFFDEIDRVGV